MRSRAQKPLTFVCDNGFEILFYKRHIRLNMTIFSYRITVWMRSKIKEITMETVISKLEVEENLKTKILIQDDFSIKDPYSGISILRKIKQKVVIDALHPQSVAMTYWYFILTVALLYNAYVIPLRACFTIYQTEESIYSKGLYI